MRLKLFLIGCYSFVMICTPYPKSTVSTLEGKILKVINARIESDSYANLYSNPLEANEKEIVVLDYQNQKCSKKHFLSNGDLRDSNSISCSSFNIWFNAGKYIIWFPNEMMQSKGRFKIQNDTIIMNSEIQGILSYPKKDFITITRIDSSASQRLKTDIDFLPLETITYKDLQKKIVGYKMFEARWDLIKAVSLFRVLE